MTLNYEADGQPEFSDKAVIAARQLGCQLVAIRCQESEEEPGVAFTAVSPFMPRVGDQLELEDGSICQVTRAAFRVQTQDELHFMAPTVYAVRRARKEDSSGVAS